MPGPPMHTSVPLPPLITSAPPPPTMHSLPLRPVIPSIPLEPSRSPLTPLGAVYVPAALTTTVSARPEHCDGLTSFAPVAVTVLPSFAAGIELPLVKAAPAKAGCVRRERYDHDPHAATW